MIEYNGICETDISGLISVEFPKVTNGKRRVNGYELPGRDGTLYDTKCTYGSTTVECTFGCLGDPALGVSGIVDACIEWIYSDGNNKLRLSETPDYFYLVEKSEVTEITRVIEHYTTITVSFSCYPYRYIYGSDTFISLQNSIFNSYYKSHPIYRIYGEGFCRLIVNGESFSAQVGQNLIIDTERKLAYRDTGELNNTSVSGDYKNLYLKRGQNTISIPSGFRVEVAPMWRVLG